MPRTEIQQNQGAVVAPVKVDAPIHAPITASGTVEANGNTGVSYTEAAIGASSLGLIAVVLGFAALVHKRDKDTTDNLAKSLHDSVPNDIATGLLTRSVPP